MTSVSLLFARSNNGMMKIKQRSLSHRFLHGIFDLSLVNLATQAQSILRKFFNEQKYFIFLSQELSLQQLLDT